MKLLTLASRIEAAGKTQCQECGTESCKNRHCSSNKKYRKPRAKKRYRSMFRADIY